MVQQEESFVIVNIWYNSAYTGNELRWKYTLCHIY